MMKESFKKSKKQGEIMDVAVKSYCFGILTILMKYQFGWAVDPHSDYFDFITKPIDFGTVKSKLDDDFYTSIDAFINDVRLKFSNEIDRMAKEMTGVLETTLKLFQEDIKSLSDGCTTSKTGPLKEKKNDLKETRKRPVQDCVSVSRKKLKKESNDFMESREKINGLTRKQNSGVSPKKPKKSMSSTGMIVVTVSAPTQDHVTADITGEDPKSPDLEVSAFKGTSNKFNVGTNVKNDKKGLKAKSSVNVGDPISDLEKSSAAADDEAKRSPNTARRIETKKLRYAETILRAKQKMAECRGEVVVLEEKRNEESRIRQRESERMALVEMERKAEKNFQEIYNMKELEMLCGYGDYSTKVLLGLPLKKLGLHLKPDDYAFEEEEKRHLEDTGEVTPLNKRLEELLKMDIFLCQDLDINF